MQEDEWRLTATAGPTHLLGQVGDATKLHAHVVGQQLDVTYGPHGGDRCEPKPWGFCQFSLLDPDANLITCGRPPVLPPARCAYARAR